MDEVREKEFRSIRQLIADGEFVRANVEIGRLCESAMLMREKPVLEDICGLCGEPGANKIPHPERWPGERAPDTELVHDECEKLECERAHAALSDDQRREHLAKISRG
jgi:hypothetical protein